MTFASQYRAAVADRGRLCVGIDPHPGLLEQWGLRADTDGLARFADRCVEAFGPTAAVIKPQVAFFEAYGSAGFAVLESVIARCRDHGALVLSDAKRGDIGSTMTAYAQAWLGADAPLSSDAVTVSPYLGFRALTPVLELAQRNNRAMFVLARTSNPESVAVQCALFEGQTVSQGVVDEAATINSDGAATVGVVVGATTAQYRVDLSEVGGPILAPGLGVQGARPEDLPERFSSADRSWLLPAASRSILAAGPDVDALRAAAATTRDAVEAALG